MHSEPVGTTTASVVAPLPADRSAPWPVWISFATPCTGVFLPTYIDGIAPAALARGGAAFEDGSAWWTFHRLAEAAAGDFAARTPVLRDGWAPLEEKIESERRGVEEAAHAASRGGDPDRAAEIVSDFMARTVDEALARAEELRARIAR